MRRAPPKIRGYCSSMLFLRGVMLPEIDMVWRETDVVMTIFRKKLPSGWFIGSKQISISPPLLGKTGCRSNFALVQLHPPVTSSITMGLFALLVKANFWHTAPPSSAIVPKSWRDRAKSKAPPCSAADVEKTAVNSIMNIGKNRFPAQSYTFV